jgi:hypothetical protein
MLQLVSNLHRRRDALQDGGRSCCQAFSSVFYFSCACRTLDISPSTSSIDITEKSGTAQSLNRSVRPAPSGDGEASGGGLIVIDKDLGEMGPAERLRRLEGAVAGLDDPVQRLTTTGLRCP